EFEAEWLKVMEEKAPGYEDRNAGRGKGVEYYRFLMRYYWLKNDPEALRKTVDLMLREDYSPDEWSLLLEMAEVLEITSHLERIRRLANGIS
ncbi:hypothetical protein ACFL5K_06455, partial [Gemmatimonadota bacterium]